MVSRSLRGAVRARHATRTRRAPLEYVRHRVPLPEGHTAGARVAHVAAQRRRAGHRRARARAPPRGLARRLHSARHRARA